MCVLTNAPFERKVICWASYDARFLYGRHSTNLPAASASAWVACSMRTFARCRSCRGERTIRSKPSGFECEAGWAITISRVSSVRLTFTNLATLSTAVPSPSAAVNRNALVQAFCPVRLPLRSRLSNMECGSGCFQSTAKQYGFRDVVCPVATLPVHPHVFKSEKPVKSHSIQTSEHAGKVDHVLSN